MSVPFILIFRLPFPQHPRPFRHHLRQNVFGLSFLFMQNTLSDSRKLPFENIQTEFLYAALHPLHRHCRHLPVPVIDSLAEFHKIITLQKGQPRRFPLIPVFQNNSLPFVKNAVSAPLSFYHTLPEKQKARTEPPALQNCRIFT